MIRAGFKSAVDFKLIERRLRRKKRTILFRTGGWTLKILRQAIGRGKKSSRPGQAPKGKVGTLKRQTAFAVEPETDTVVIGVIPLKTKGTGKLLTSASVPQELEEGGRERLTMPGGAKVTVTYLPRPYLGPIQPRAEETFRNNIETVPF